LSMVSRLSAQTFLACPFDELVLLPVR
jgi:hypothetical protein